MDNDAVKQNISNKTQWQRILYVLLFALVLYPVMMLMAMIVFVQVIFALFTGKANENLTEFADDMTRYIQQILSFMTYGDDRKPFPFNDWNSSELDDDYMSSVDDMGDVAHYESDTDNQSKE